MGKSNIDPIIQGKLQNLKSDLDKEALWNAISGSIPTPPVPEAAPVVSTAKSTTQVAKMASLLLLLTLTAGMVYYLNSSDQVQGSGQTVSEIEIVQSHTDVKSKPTPTTNQKTEAVSGTPSTAKSIVSVNSNLQKATLTSAPSESASKEQTSNTNYKNTTPQSPIKASNTFTLSTENPAPTQQSAGTAITASNTSKQSTVVNAKQGRQATIAPQSQTPASNQAATQSLISVASLNQVRSNTLGQTKKVEISLANLAPIKDKVNCYDYSSQKPSISLTGYYGPGLSIRSLKANDDAEMINYQSAREESEVLLENHRAGLQLKASHKSGIYGKVGIEASVINEKFSQYTETRREEVQYGLIETITYPDGQIEEVYGDRIVTIISKKEWKNYNKFETIDLSAFLGYEMAVNKWRYHIEGGVLYNLGTRFEGTFLDPTTLLPEKVGTDYYKSKTGIDLHLAAGIGYDLTPNLTMTLSPSLRYDLKEVNQSTFPLDQKYLMVSLLAGAEYRF